LSVTWVNYKGIYSVWFRFIIGRDSDTSNNSGEVSLLIRQSIEQDQSRPKNADGVTEVEKLKICNGVESVSICDKTVSMCSSGGQAGKIFSKEHPVPIWRKVQQSVVKLNRNSGEDRWEKEVCVV